MASNKNALAMCDTCGFVYPHRVMRLNSYHMITCPDCFEPKAPQIDPRPVVSDPEALYKPRPNNDLEVGEGFVVVSDPSNFSSTSVNSFAMNSSILGSNFSTPKMTATLGTVTITT